MPLADNFERALSYDPEDANISALYKQLMDILDKMNIKAFESDGEQFDPNVHNAVMHVDDEALGENEVVEVFMKGYAKGDKVLRHSMVKVAN